jgi:hypothetical protein
MDRVLKVLCIAGKLNVFLVSLTTVLVCQYIPPPGQIPPGSTKTALYFNEEMTLELKQILKVLDLSGNKEKNS